MSETIKATFDIDIIFGMVVAFVYDWIWTTIKKTYLDQYLTGGLAFDFCGIDIKDAAVLGTLILFSFITKGKIRKILATAFFFALYFQLADWYWTAGPHP